VRQIRKRAGWRDAAVLLIASSAVAFAAPTALGATLGGDLTAATDYIFRGISQNDGNAAAQFELHAGSNDGYFVGVWGTTLDSRYRRADYEAEIYVGKRFDLSSAWSASLNAVDYLYVQRRGTRANDYQELSASITYLDSVTLSVAGSPNTVRYSQGYRLGRQAAYDADLTGQWPLIGSLYVTAGAGYYYLTGPSTGPAAAGYAYGNAGLAVEWQAWRLDVGYFFAGQQAQRLYPAYASNDRVAATLNWRF
jgi:uncharacterized protein (TIGR02001 family)